MAQGVNAFSLLPDDNDGDIDEFISIVASEAKISEEVEKKQRQELKAVAKQQQQEENRLLNPQLDMEAKRPIIPERLERSHIVIRKPKLPKNKEQDKKEGKDPKKTEEGKKEDQDTGLANGHRQEAGNYRVKNHYKNNNRDNGYQRNYQGRDFYKRNYERGNHHNNNGGEGVLGEGNYGKNYGRANFYQDNNNGGEDGYSYVAYRVNRRGRGFIENYNDGGRREWSEKDGNMNSSDNNRTGDGVVQVSDNPEKKHHDTKTETEQQPVNGDGGEEAAGADSKEGKEKKKNNNNKPQVEVQNPENTMTLKEYEKKVLAEKKKALEAVLVNSERPEATNLDNKDNFDSMRPIGKNTEASKVVKPTISEDNLKKKDGLGVGNKEKASKSMSIDQFLRPPPRRYGNGRGRGGFQGGRPIGDNNNGTSDRDQEVLRQSSPPPPPPSFEDMRQFPALGEKLQ